MRLNLASRNHIRSKLAACAALRLLADGYDDNRWTNTAKLLELEAHSLWNEGGLEDTSTAEILKRLEEPMLLLSDRKQTLSALVSSVLMEETPEGGYTSEYVWQELFGTGPLERSERWPEIYRLCNEVMELEADVWA
jgi:hypothetical protein